MSELIEIKCKSCVSNKMVEEDGFLVCQNCGTKHTIPHSFKGVGKVVLNKVTPAKVQGGSKAIFFYMANDCRPHVCFYSMGSICWSYRYIWYDFVRIFRITHPGCSYASCRHCFLAIRVIYCSGDSNFWGI